MTDKNIIILADLNAESTKGLIKEAVREVIDEAMSRVGEKDRDDLIDSAEAMKILNCGMSLLSKYRKAGLRYIHSKPFKYHREDIEEWKQKITTLNIN